MKKENMILIIILNTNFALNQHKEFKISFSFSGIFLEQCQEFYPEVIQSFQELVKTGQV